MELVCQPNMRSFPNTYRNIAIVNTWQLIRKDLTNGCFALPVKDFIVIGTTTIQCVVSEVLYFVLVFEKQFKYISHVSDVTACRYNQSLFRSSVRKKWFLVIFAIVRNFENHDICKNLKNLKSKQ